MAERCAEFLGIVLLRWRLSGVAGVVPREVQPPGDCGPMAERQLFRRVSRSRAPADRRDAGPARIRRAKAREILVRDCARGHCHLSGLQPGFPADTPSETRALTAPPIEKPLLF